MHSSILIFRLFHIPAAGEGHGSTPSPCSHLFPSPTLLAALPRNNNEPQKQTSYICTACERRPLSNRKQLLCSCLRTPKRRNPCPPSNLHSLQRHEPDGGGQKLSRGCKGFYPDERAQPHRHSDRCGSCRLALCPALLDEARPGLSRDDHSG